MRAKSVRLNSKNLYTPQQVVMVVLLVIGAAVASYLVTLNQYLGSDASTSKVAMVEETEGPILSQYGYLWPNRAGAFLDSNEPWPWMTYISITKGKSPLKFTQAGTNPSFTVAYYGKLTEPVWYTNGTYPNGEEQTTGQIYGWTKAPCQANNSQFFFHPITQLPNGNWQVSGNELISFPPLMSTAMHCAVDTAKGAGWNSFWGEAVYPGNMNQEIVAGAISFAPYNAGSAKDWEIAKFTLNQPIQPWPKTE